MKTFEKDINSTEDMIAFGEEIGSRISGGTVLELIGDVGAGKTTFTKGLARALGILKQFKAQLLQFQEFMKVKK